MSEAQRIVVRSPNWLGDVVMALPAMAALRRHFEGAHLTIAAVPAVAAVFREDTDVRQDAVLELPASPRGAIARLEGEGFDLGVLLPNSFGSAWQFWRARVRERWGWPTSGRRLLLTRASRGVIARGAHQADYYRALVGGLGIAVAADEAPRIAPGHPSVERAAAVLREHTIDPDRPIVGIAPGAAYGQAKQWHPDRMAEVAAGIVRARQATVILAGASHDREAARAIESWLRTHASDAAGRVVNLAGRTSLGALIGLTARMAAFVSNDSGAMHVAAATGCPVVAIFGPTDERVTRPLGHHTVMTAPVFCRPCLLRDCPIDHRCMKRVQATSVVRALVAALDAGREARS